MKIQVVREIVATVYEYSFIDVPADIVKDEDELSDYVYDNDSLLKFDREEVIAGNHQGTMEYTLVE